LPAGIILLFCNIMVQLETGAFVEREWLIYVASAWVLVAVGCSHAHNSSVGPSGAVMGLFGGKGLEVFVDVAKATTPIKIM
jgi:hypothetical protein